MALVANVKQQFNGVIWRMEIDPVSNTLFLEIRNDADKQVSFASVSLTAAKVNFIDLKVDERWLTGIETAYDGVLLLYGLASEASPQHKGVTAVDGITGATPWSNYNYAFNHLSNQGPVCFDLRIQPRKLFIIDIYTGNYLRSFNPATDQDLQNNIKWPEPVEVSGSVLNQLPQSPFGNMINQLIHNEYRIVSLHAQKDHSLNQLLYVFYQDKLLFSDLLATDIQKMQPEAFVMQSNHLIYLKNRVELNVINLEN